MNKYFSSIFCVFVLLSVSLAGCIAEDGVTVDGAERIMDINPDGDSNPIIYGKVGAYVLFSADDGVHGKELWRTGGAKLTTEMVTDIYVGDGIGDKTTILNDNLYFLAKTSIGSCEIYRSDGTEAGTIKITEDLGLHCSGTRFMEVLDDYRIVIANLGDMYVLNTDTLTVEIAISDSSILQFGVVDTNSDLIYFLKESDSTGAEPWVSDGTSIGTHLLKDIEPGVGHSKPSDFVLANGDVYFIAENDDEGRELWKTDGTESGTIMMTNWTSCDGDRRMSVARTYGSGFSSDVLSSNDPKASMVVGQELVPSSESSEMGRAAMTRDVLFFIGKKRYDCDSDSPVPFYGMLRSDGTHDGTYAVYPSSGNSIGRLIISQNQNYVYPILDGPVSFDYLLRVYSINSNSTEIIAEEVEVDYNTRSSISPNLFCEIDDTMYISLRDQSDDGNTGFELWATDGTITGTTIISDVNPGSARSDPAQFYCTSSTVYFTAEGEGGRELWKHRP